MTYAAATRYIESLAILGMRFGLERMHRLLVVLGDPQTRAPAIHVVGTNGKSSTVRLAAAALRSQGAAVGAYLSPHVTGWRERIELNQRPLSQRRFAEAIGAARDAVDTLGLAEDDQVTQFEVLTAAAFHAFADARAEVLVVEAGLGGRYDATNVLAPDAVVVLTNVALEHTELLGSTEADITAEKLAVAADGCDRLAVGALTPPAAAAVAAQCRARNLAPWRLGSEIAIRAGKRGVDVETPHGVTAGLPLGLRGDYQRDNLAVAIAATQLRLDAPLRLGPLRRAIGTVRMPGRMEVVAEQPLVVLDGAHNPAGMVAMTAAVPSVVGTRPTVAVVSVLGDKDATAMINSLAEVCTTVVATRSSHPRAASVEVLAHLAALAGMRAERVEDAHHAIARARDLAGTGGAVLVCGSLYLLADVRSGLMA